jgi:hypothetical protein
LFGKNKTWVGYFKTKMARVLNNSKGFQNIIACDTHTLATETKFLEQRLTVFFLDGQ